MTGLVGSVSHQRRQALPLVSAPLKIGSLIANIAKQYQDSVSYIP